MRPNLEKEAIRKKWDQEAVQHSTSRGASWGDLLILRETRVVSKYLHNAKNVLDAGCANGFSTVRYVMDHPALNVLGIDFSAEMIRMAQVNLDSLNASQKQRVLFREGDVLNLSASVGDQLFDHVITKRVICNLTSEDEQVQSAINFYNVLNPNGLYLCSEPSIEGLGSVNQWRKKWGLPLVEEPWHNLYLRESTFIPRLANYFDLVKIDYFASTYYFGSRVFNAWLAKLFNFETKHDSFINYVSQLLPSFGKLGIQRLYVFKKK